MPLTPGTRLGPYEILAPVGAGGMGEVWKALDTRLGRTVAVKVCKTEFTERFEREARAVAALNHHNICTLHDVGPNYLVMELLEGAPLKGPVAIEIAVEYAGQILDALEAAHGKGIVHRDLKPANILVTRQGIKLLDFGLARQVAAPLGDLDATLTQALTNRGEIAGTLQYMAPEQLQGRDADARSDLFAFGCVFYELISGQPAFTGENAASLIAAVMERQPAPLNIPPPLDRIIRICLAKDPCDRFQTAIDLKRALGWALDSTAAASAATSAKRVSRSKWLPVAILAAALATFGIGFLLRPAAPAEIVMYPLLLGKFTSQYGVMPPILSPDGRQLAYIDNPVQGRRQVFVRHLDSLNSQVVPGTAGASAAAWAPDSHRLVYAADTKIKTVDLLTGATREVDDSAGMSILRFAWGAGAILYSRTNSPLMRMPESGGTAGPATDMSQVDTGHDFPSFCPDGRHFVFRAYRKDGQTELRLGILGSPSKGIVLEAAHMAACTSIPGTFGDETYLVEMAHEALTARRLDLSRGRLSAAPLVIASVSALQNGFLAVQSSRLYGGSRISAGSNGTLAYWLGTAGSGRLTWHDRAGNILEELPAAAAGSSPALSWDGSKVAVGRASDDGLGIWVTDLTRKTSQKLILPGRGVFLPIWSPDGSRIAFSAEGGVFEGPATGGEARLVAPLRAWTQQYTADGRHVLFINVAKADLELLPLDGDANPTVIAPSGPTYFPATFAPGEAFIAYTSSESGQPEVYVRAVPPATGKWLISNQGGGMAAWRGDGKELFYESLDLKLMAVDITLSPKFQASTPKPLFQTKVSGVLAGRNNFVVSGDGRRFLIWTPPDDSQADSVYVVVDWPALLKKDAAGK